MTILKNRLRKDAIPNAWIGLSRYELVLNYDRLLARLSVQLSTVFQEFVGSLRCSQQFFSDKLEYLIWY